MSEQHIANALNTIEERIKTLEAQRHLAQTALDYIIFLCSQVNSSEARVSFLTERIHEVREVAIRGRGDGWSAVLAAATGESNG